jgi:hypothetical protein
LPGVDGVLREPAGGGIQLLEPVDCRARRPVGILVVLEDSLDATMMLPALEDVSDGVGGLLPVEVGMADEFEKGEPVFGSFASARCQPSRRNRERTEVGTIEPAIECASERSLRDDDEVVLPALLVELFDRFCPAYCDVSGHLTHLLKL